MQEIQVPSLGWEDPLEKEMETHSSILAWEMPWTEETGGIQSMGSQRVEYILATKQQSLFLHMKGQLHAIQYCFHFGNFVEH